MTTKTVYVVRHCQAQGQEPDAELTEQGIEQAGALATFFLDKKIDRIVTSPFERAYCTIAPLAEQLGMETIVDDRLMERVLVSGNYHNWQEMLRATYADLDICYEGGESSNEAMSRAVAVVMENLRSEYHHIVLVSHGNLISLLLKHFDHRIGFGEWEALTNPDVYSLIFSEQKLISMERVWTG